MQVVRYKHGGKTNFEIGCKVGAPLKYRKGTLTFENTIQSEEVWKDIKKGERANADELVAAFDSSDFPACAKIILEKGEILLTDAERKEILEKKRNEIVNYFHKYYIDPKTKTAIPVQRISNALNELKIKIDIDVPVDRQTADIAKRLPEVLSIKRAEICATITTTHQYIAQVTNVFKKYNINVKHENYTNEGCSYSVAMVPGDYDKILADLNQTTKGSFEFEMEGGGMVTSTDSVSEKGRGRGKKK